MNNTFNLNKITRPDLSSLEPYVAELHPGIIKMDANENPFDFPPEITTEIWRRLGGQTFTRYPDPVAQELVKALSLYTGVSPSGIMVGNGSDELILNLMLAFGTGGKVLIATPTFSMYRIHAQVAAAQPVSIPRGNNFELDIDAISEAAKLPESRMVIICSPNNPTGNASSLEEIAAVLETCPKTLVVVDEAYIEFGGQTCIPLLERYPNLVVLRTFSKAFGLAGLRVGYMLAGEHVIKELMRVKQPFNLNVFSQMAALLVLEHRQVFQDQLAQILHDRDFVISQLTNLPEIAVFPTVTNFVLFRTKFPASAIYQFLLENGILIRNCSGPGLEECLRVSVGREEENRLFLAKLKLALESKHDM